MRTLRPPEGKKHSGGGGVDIGQALEQGGGQGGGEQRGAGKCVARYGGCLVRAQVLLDGRTLVREAVRRRHRVAQRCLQVMRTDPKTKLLLQFQQRKEETQSIVGFLFVVSCCLYMKRVGGSERCMHAVDFWEHSSYCALRKQTRYTNRCSAAHHELVPH